MSEYTLASRRSNRASRPGQQSVPQAIPPSETGETIDQLALPEAMTLISDGASEPMDDATALAILIVDPAITAAPLGTEMLASVSTSPTQLSLPDSNEPVSVLL